MGRVDIRGSENSKWKKGENVRDGKLAAHS